MNVVMNCSVIMSDCCQRHRYKKARKEVVGEVGPDTKLVRETKVPDVSESAEGTVIRKSRASKCFSCIARKYPSCLFVLCVFRDGIARMSPPHRQLVLRLYVVSRSSSP